jgi:hypothetical protein
VATTAVALLAPFPDPVPVVVWWSLAAVLVRGERRRDAGRGEAAASRVPHVGRRGRGHGGCRGGESGERVLLPVPDRPGAARAARGQPGGSPAGHASGGCPGDPPGWQQPRRRVAPAVRNAGLRNGVGGAGPGAGVRVRGPPGLGVSPARLRRVAAAPAARSGPAGRPAGQSARLARGRPAGHHDGPVRRRARRARTGGGGARRPGIGPGEPAVSGLASRTGTDLPRRRRAGVGPRPPARPAAPSTVEARRTGRATAGPAGVVHPPRSRWSPCCG